MASTLRQRAAELFKAALGLDQVTRTAFLDQRCDGDAALRQEVESLLTADERAQAFLAAPPEAVQSLAAVEADALLGQSVGGYRIVRWIASGGMGTVYEALDERLGRTVALKLVRGGSASPDALRRFEHEAKLLARLRHPAIAQIYEVGAHRDREGILGPAGGSVPFFAMEYVSNARTVLDFAREGGLTTHQRVELFAHICDAVQYGHQRGVIHRDLKPSNILIAGGDEKGTEGPRDLGTRGTKPGDPIPSVPRSLGPSIPEVKIIDFGVALAIDSDHALTSIHTAYGQLVGTLQYMSPEQCGPDPHDIDVRSDIYALGVVLFELLTGQPPYSVQRMTMLEATRVIREDPPPRLSAIDRALRGDLDTVVRKALDKDRGRRYPSAGELARDLRHYLADEAIEAKRDSGWYVLRKTLQIYRRGVAIAAAFVVLVTAATIALSILYVRQRLLTLEVAQQRDAAEYESFVANIAAAGAAIEVQDGGAALARLQTVPAERRNWEWHYLARQADQSVATWHGPKELITGRVRLSPDGRYVGALFWMEERASALRVWSRTSQHPAAEFTSSGPWVPFEFLGGGEQLLVCDRDGRVSRFDLTERREISHRRITALRQGETAVGLSPDGRTLLTAAKGGYHLWDTAADRLLHALTVSDGGWTTVLEFDATGGRLVIGLNEGTIILWDVASGRELAQTKAHAGQVHGVAFSPDGGLLATAGEGGALKLWDLSEDVASPETTTHGYVPSLRMIGELHDGGQRNGNISFSPDGKLLAIPSEDKTVRIWSVAEGEMRSTLLGHTTGVVCTAFSSDGRFVVSGAREGVVKLWDLEKSPAVRAFRELPGPLNSIAFMPDGARLLLDCATAACVVDFASGQRLHEIPLAPADQHSLALPGPNGSQATLADMDGGIRIWEFDDGGESRVIGMHKSTPVLAGDPSGRVLASVDEEAIVLWDWAEGRESRRFVGPGEALRSLALSYDASRLALGLKTGELVICDARTGERTPVERAHSGSVASVAFHPDGRRLASGSVDGIVKLWDVTTGRVKWSASPQLGDVWCVAFSPDGTRLAAGGRDRSVRIFDPQTGRELLALRGPTGTVMCLAFSPDGKSIAAGSWAREVFIWAADPATGGP